MHKKKRKLAALCFILGGKNKVQLLVEEKKDMIKNFLFLIMGDEESIIVQIKTDLSLAELEQKTFHFKK